MKSFVSFKFRLVAIIFTLTFAGISNAAVSTKTVNAIAKTLSAQMKIDLADKTATVEIVRADEIEITKAKQILFGEALYESKVKREKVPIYFEAVVDNLRNEIAMVDYTFVEGESQVNVDFLQKLIVKKLGNDFRTKEVALAVTDIRKAEEIEKSEKYRGTGEVRIGSLVWKKIKFEIQMNGDSETIIYKLNDM